MGLPKFELGSRLQYVAGRQIWHYANKAKFQRTARCLLGQIR